MLQTFFGTEVENCNDPNNEFGKVLKMCLYGINAKMDWKTKLFSMCKNIILDAPNLTLFICVP